MNITQPCKSCKRPIHAEVDEFDIAHAKSQGVLSDFMGWVKRLTPMITCNRCYDFIMTRGGIEEKITNVCYDLHREGQKADHSKFVQALVDLTKKYAEVVAAFYGTQDYVWDGDFVDMLVRDPLHSRKILEGYMTVIRNRVNQKETVVTI